MEKHNGMIVLLSTAQVVPVVEQPVEMVTVIMEKVDQAVHSQMAVRWRLQFKLDLHYPALNILVDMEHNMVVVVVAVGTVVVAVERGMDTGG